MRLWHIALRYTWQAGLSNSAWLMTQATCTSFYITLTIPSLRSLLWLTSSKMTARKCSYPSLVAPYRSVYFRTLDIVTHEAFSGKLWLIHPGLLIVLPLSLAIVLLSQWYISYIYCTIFYDVSIVYLQLRHWWKSVSSPPLPLPPSYTQYQCTVLLYHVMWPRFCL